MIVASNNKTLYLILTTGLLALALTGCGMGSGNVATGGSITPVVPAEMSVSGQVYGGQQAISGAEVMMWQVNTNGTAATALLNAPVTTNGNGVFTLSGFITNFSTICAAGPQVYLTATLGNPGAGTNSSLALMTAIGSCSQLNANSHIQLNEATTVAAVWALQQFFGVSEGTAPNTSTGNPAEDIVTSGTTQSNAGMVNAFLTANLLVSYSNGAVNTSNANIGIESNKIYAIANILAACVNSNGTGDCPSLFSAVTQAGDIFPGDTIQAALYMAQNPSYNVSTVYGLQPATPPFPTNIASAPFDWSLAITYSGSAFDVPNLVASDATGNIWVTNQASKAQSLAEITPGGSTSSYLTGGSAFTAPQADVIDRAGRIWITGNTTNNLVEFTPGTTPTTTLYTAPTGCGPYQAAIDASNDVFFACNGLTSPYLYEMQASSIGSTTPAYTAIGPLYSATPSSGPTESYGMAIDSDNNVWVTDTKTYEGMSEFTGATNNIASSPTNFSLGTAPYSVAIDSGNNAWAINSGYLEEYAINSKTSSSPTYTTSDYTGSGLTSAGGVAIDGSGNIWASNRNLTTISGTSYLTLSEFNSVGSPLGQGNSTTQPGGLSNAVTVNGVNVSDAEPRGLAIDPSGNVWIAGCALSTTCEAGTGNVGAYSYVMEFVGVATPPYLPLSSAIAANKLGCCTYTHTAPAGTSPAATPGYVGLQASTTAGNPAFTQNSGQFYFLVTRTGGFTGALTVKYSYASPSSGTAAVYNTDYNDATQSASGITPYTTANGYGTLTWASGDTSSRTIGPINWLDTTANGPTKAFVINLNCSATCTGYSPYQSETVSVTAANTAPSTITAFSNYISSGNGSGKEGMYLGLPIDEYGGTGGLNGAQFGWQIVTTTALNNFSDTYFYATTGTVNGNAGTKVIVFTSPTNGATSSPGSGSNDTRSEMREYYYGSTGNINGDDWDTAVGGTLTATVAVNSTSVDTNEATIGQVHGENEPYALLEYEPSCTYNSTAYTGCVVLAYSVTNSTNSASSSNLLAYNVPTCSVSSLSTCTFFTYQLQVLPNGGTPLLNASVTNIYGTGTIFGSASVTIDPSWIGTGTADGLYFKFGAYSGANNTGNPAGDQTQITFAFPTTACNVSTGKPQFCISHP